MSTLQKFAALPIDKYIDILEKLKGLKESVSPAVQSAHSPVIYQDGAGADNEIIGQSDHQRAKSTAPPPPGLPAEDELVNADSEAGEGDNWIDVWQALN